MTTTKESIENRSFKKQTNHTLDIQVVTSEELLKFGVDVLARPHRTNFYHIFLFDKASVHEVDFEKMNIPDCSLLFLDKDKVHCFDKQLCFEGELIVFMDTLFSISDFDHQFLQNCTLFSKLYDTQVIELPADKYQKVKNTTRYIHQILNTLQPPPHQLLVKNLLQNLLILAQQCAEAQGFEPIKSGAELDYLLLFETLLEQHFKQQHQVSFYARQILISEKKLHKVTTQILGKPPKQLIDERVILEAKRLLSYSQDSVKTIAYDLGFDEPTNFIKFFKKHTDQTPNNFRQKQQLA